MRLRRSPHLLALIALVLASLACNAVMGGGDEPDLEATAASLETEAADALDDVATPDLGDLSDDDLEPTDEPLDDEGEDVVEEEPTEDLGDDSLETPEAGGDDPLNFDDVPDDVPVYDGAEVQDLFAAEDMVSFTTTGEFQEVVDFYVAEMPANGWEEDAETTVTMEGLASLGYTKDGRTASLLITLDASSDETLVMILIAEQ
jgi:hypothetical protein